MSEKNFASYGDMETLVTEIVDKCGPYTKISYEDWLQLTPYQQEHGRWDVTGVPGADGTISIDLMTKLWENPSPRSNIAAGTLVDSIEDYDFYLVIAKKYTSTTYQKSYLCVAGNNEITAYDTPVSTASGCGMAARVLTFGSSVTISDCNFRWTGGNNTSNNYIIPTVIYGIKLHHTVEIKAIAPTVSTLAEKCMLSDGVTSVKDALDALEIKYAEYTGTTDASGILEVTTIPANSIMLQIVATATNNFCLNSRVGDYNNNPRIAIFSMSTIQRLANTSVTVYVYYIEVASS